MIDSIALTIPCHEVVFMDHDAFTPSAAGLLVPPYYPIRRGGMACVNNPAAPDKLRFGHMPRLTLYKRPARQGFNMGLRVDLSLPKLKYGNNFDELLDSDFTFLCRQLSLQMSRMGVRVSPETIRKAEVSSIHYGKNLPLTDYTGCHMVIHEIAKGSVTKLLDSLKTDYQNDGSAIRFHATSHEVIVYDKIKDLERGKTSDKRAIENDNHGQLSLLSTPFKKPFEVLRLEVRLGNRRKIKNVLERLDQSRPMTFESLYSSDLAKAVLLDYWRKITPDVPLLACSGFASGELYDALARDMPKAKPTQILSLVGALSIIHKEGMRGLRTRLEGHSTSRAWYRLKRQLGQLSVTSHMKYNALRVAEGHLLAFTPLNLDSYKTEGYQEEAQRK